MTHERLVDRSTTFHLKREPHEIVRNPIDLLKVRADQGERVRESYATALMKEEGSLIEAARVSGMLLATADIFGLMHHTQTALVLGAYTTLAVSKFLLHDTRYQILSRTVESEAQVFPQPTQ